MWQMVDQILMLPLIVYNALEEFKGMVKFSEVTDPLITAALDARVNHAYAPFSSSNCRARAVEDGSGGGYSNT